MGVMLFLQLMVGFQTVQVNHDKKFDQYKLLQLGADAWFAKQHYLHVFFMQGSYSQIKTLLGTALKRHNTDLSEFVELFSSKSVCTCEPDLRGGEKALWKTYLSIAQ